MKKPPEGGGWYRLFSNMAVTFLNTFVVPIDLAEAVRFELTEDSHPRQFSRLLHSTTLPSFQNSGNYRVIFSYLSIFFIFLPFDLVRIYKCLN